MASSTGKSWTCATPDSGVQEVFRRLPLPLQSYMLDALVGYALAVKPETGTSAEAEAAKN